LVDGTYELFRAYYGAPQATDRSGREVGATRGIARSLLALLGEPNVTHVACAFDHVIESFRNDLFPGYKTGEGIDPALLGQFGLAERVCHALGIVVWPMVEFEADDALATGAARYCLDPRVERVFVCSPDKDLTQCVTDDPSVVCLDRMRRRVIDRDGVIEKFGVPPEAIPDYLALVGDSADGIPGIPRWGAKSAAALLDRYGSIEALFETGGRWDVTVRGAAALWKNLAPSRDAALLYKRLATLRLDVPLDETVDGLEWTGARRSALESICAEIDDAGLVDRVSRWRD
jgi:5'-3' exonuclease